MSLEHSPGRQDGTAGGILDEYLTDEELAAALRVTKRTLERWRRMREAPPSVKMGSRRLTRKDAVPQWLASREQAA
jgi:excisionase family DNA binding protein